MTTKWSLYLRIPVCAFTAQIRAHQTYRGRRPWYNGRRTDPNPISQTGTAAAAFDFRSQGDFMNTTLHYQIPQAGSGRTISVFLLDTGYSARLLAHLRSAGGSFLLNGTPAFSNALLQEGDHLTVQIKEKKCSAQISPSPVPLSVLYEDEHLAVINKPAGMPVHPSQGHREDTLANAAAWHYRNQADSFVFRAVNRLDRDTSGLLLLANNMLSSCILSEQVGCHALHREYCAIVCGKPEPSGTVSLPIARKDGSTIERVCDAGRGDPAVTHYRLLAYNKDTDLSLIRLLLETGRTHQIRVHMKAIGHPIPGDFLYHPDFRRIKRQALHSALLRFSHPITGASMEFTAPLPEDMSRLFPGDYDLLSPFG